jgi:hypothetical protein
VLFSARAGITFEEDVVGSRMTVKKFNEMMAKFEGSHLSDNLGFRRGAPVTGTPLFYPQF